MATYNFDTFATRPVAEGNGSFLTSVTYEYTTKSTEALANSDILQALKIPQGCQIQDMTLICEDIDGATAAVISVGDTEDPDRYFANSTLGQAGGVARMSLVTGFTNIDTTAKETINITIVTAPGTQVNDRKIKLNVLFLSDQPA